MKRPYAVALTLSGVALAVLSIVWIRDPFTAIAGGMLFSVGSYFWIVRR